MYPFEQYHRYQRAVEEIRLLKNEADSIISFGLKAVELLRNALDLLDLTINLNLQQLGERYLLEKKLESAQIWLHEQDNQLRSIHDTTTQSSIEEDNEVIEHGIINSIGDVNDTPWEIGNQNPNNPNNPNKS
ncbi:hypothetical protein INT45_001989 [Circinella minor]|uniref:Uncharacterized protein n=1 Tax=Circinella minor TaxID=1195481 RepID=A0A8H7RVI2_9FUNG|nr:hypothetical protein INT45_001989 [Circinella minor]